MPTDPRRQWELDLLESFLAADSSVARARVLRKFAQRYALGEAAALQLYRADQAVARDFILRHLPRNYTGDSGRTLWSGLLDEALTQGDQAFHDLVYRRQVPTARWQVDIMELARNLRDPVALCQELERRHPLGAKLDLAPGLYELAASRGEDVLPYLQRHLCKTGSQRYRSGLDRMLVLARSRGWWEIWGTLLRNCARTADFNREVAALVRDSTLPESDLRARLLLLTGSAREASVASNAVARIPLLEDSTAHALYARFPDLVRNAFRQRVAPTLGRSFGGLLQRAIQASDEVLIDFLCAHLAARGGVYADDQLQKAAEQAAKYYATVRLDPVAFAGRAAGVLTQIPAGAIHDYRELIQTNRLAQLLFERDDTLYLANPAALSDLLEAGECHVQAIAFRALARNDQRARQLAQDHLALLLGTLLRPLSRGARMLAIKALRNAASSRDSARQIAARAREALELTEAHSTKAALLELIAVLLHRYPALRDDDEQLPVYRRAA